MEDSEKDRYIEYLLERLDETKRARELSAKCYANLPPMTIGIR